MVSVSDLASFFLATGVALAIALLAWGEEIRKPSKEIREIEDKFVDRYGVKKQDLKTIISSEKNQRPNFYQFMSSLAGIIKKVPSEKVELVKKIEEIQKIALRLEEILSFKYYFTIGFSFFLLIGAAIIFLVEEVVYPYFALEKIHLVSKIMTAFFFVCTIVGFIIILASLVHSRTLENRLKNISLEIEDGVG